MKTVLFVECGSSGYGGSFQCLYQTIKILSPEKYRIIVVFLNKSVFYERLRNEGIECHYITDTVYSNGSPFLKYILGKINGFVLKCLAGISVTIEYLIHFITIRKLISLVREEKVDLIHLNNQLVINFFGLIAARATDTPCVVHLRTFNSEGLNRYKISYAKAINVRYIAISEKIKGYWAGNGIEPKRIEVIYDIFLPKMKSDACNFPLLTDYTGYKIVFVGRLIECKGIPFLLDSFSELVKTDIDARLFLIGDGEDMEKIKEYVSTLDIDDDVLFLGHKDDPQAIMRQADVVVLPSKEEGLGRVLLEAMDAGTPVIGTRVGGIPEIIKHETNGLLVDYGDVTALKDSLLKVLKDRSLREKIVSGGYETVRSRFKAEVYKNKLEEVYDSLLVDR